jgi:hypothetical protein
MVRCLRGVIFCLILRHFLQVIHYVPPYLALYSPKSGRKNDILTNYFTNLMFAKKLLLSLLMTLVSTVVLLAQVTLTGTISDSETGSPLGDASVSINGKPLFASSNASGVFEIQNVPKGKCTVVVTRAGYQPYEVTLELQPTVKGIEVVRIILKKDQAAAADNSTTPGTAASGDIPTVTLDEAESETDGASEVANLLHASRDVFQTVSAFGWSFFRFRERGYESENFPLFLNGVSINDPETGGAFFGEFGGLNDVLRARETSIGIEASEFAFAEIGGSTLLDTRASVQRKGVRASHAISNRTYRHRTMLTMNTGLMPGGWAVSVSGSRRWADEGWYEGTPFEGSSYFLSVDKKLKKHTFNITVLGAPTKRGRNGDAPQEMFELAGNTRYNPSWGYWNGEKRNANIAHSNQPIATLRWDWTPSTSTNLTWTTYGQAGKRGQTRLDWFGAQNPNPDYNRRLPSALGDPTLTAQWADLMRNNQAYRQIDWAGIWEANSIDRVTVNNVNGIGDNTVTGNKSTVLLSDFREDSKELGTNLLVKHKLNNRTTINGGANFQYYLGRNFKTVDDLLGGDFHVDLNPLALQDLQGNTFALNNDLRTPNRVVREGDTYGWDYDENIRKGGAWAQVVSNLRKWSFFGGAEANTVTMWRTGHMQNGRYPDNSLGNSDKINFTTYGVKGGATYKVNGRNYIYANGFQGTRAPLFRDIFLSPRTRNSYYEAAKPYGIYSGETGFIHRSPRLRTRVTGYWTKFDNQIESLVLFGQTTGAFGTEIRTGVDQVHSGLEAAFEARPLEAHTQWSLSGATNLGYYRYTSRPRLSFYEDNTNAVAINNVVIYQTNFLVPRTPQTTASLSVKYEGRKFWFASATVNFADDYWYEFDRARRTGDYAIQVAGAGAQPGSDDWNRVFHQGKAPAAYTLDLFGGKSWRINSKYFLILNIGLNNILDNRNVVVSGREAYFRAFKDVNDNRLYQNELIYAPGFNYFVSLTVNVR